MLNQHAAPHVAHILGYLDVRFGGPPQVARNVARELSTFDVHASIWGTSDPGEPRISDVESHAFAPQTPQSWFYCPALRRELERASADIGLMHLHEIWSYPLYAAASVAHDANRPFVVSPHGIFNRGWRYRTLKKQTYLRTIGRRIVADAAAFVAVSDTERAAIRRAGVTKPVAIVPNGIDPAWFENMPARDIADKRWPWMRDRRVILFLSRVSRTKGIEVLIDAVARLRSEPKFADVVLVIAGPDDRGYVQTVRRRIAERQQDGSTILLGLVEGDAKRELLARADIFALPSASEGQSLALLESLAAGVPAVVTPDCNFPPVRDASLGLIVTADSFTGGLRDLLEMTPSEREAMGARGRALITSNYTWRRSAERLARVYAAVLNRSSAQEIEALS